MVDKGQVTDDIAQDHRAQSLDQAESESQKDAQNENGTSTFKCWGMHDQYPLDTPLNMNIKFETICVLLLFFVNFRSSFVFKVNNNI